jgi:hypothetical protein
MFGKLLKNDLKAQFHSVYTLLFILIVSFSVLEIISSVSNETKTVVLSGFGAFLISFFIYVFIIISVGKMFSSTMFGKTGYLTLTLPVKTNQLLWSKTLSGLVWIYFAYILFIFSVIIFSKNIIGIMGTEGLETVDSLLAIFGAPSVKTVFLFCISKAFEFAVISFLIVQCIYFGITLSHVTPFNKLKKLGTIIFTCTSYYIVKTFSDKLKSLFPAGAVFTSESVIFTSNYETTLQNLSSESFPLTINFVYIALLLVCSLLLNIYTASFLKNEVNVE